LVFYIAAGTWAENRVLRMIFGSKRNEAIGSGEDCIRRGFMFCTAHKILFG